MKILSKKWWNEKPTDSQSKVGLGIMLFCGIGSAVIWFTIMGIAISNTIRTGMCGICS